MIESATTARVYDRNAEIEHVHVQAGDARAVRSSVHRGGTAPFPLSRFLHEELLPQARSKGYKKGSNREEDCR